MENGCTVKREDWDKRMLVGTVPAAYQAKLKHHDSLIEIRIRLPRGYHIISYCQVI